MSRSGDLLAGCTILIVEDEPLIALEVHDAFREVGAITVAASDAEEAQRMAHSPGLSAAVVDINLGDGDCSSVCQLLAKLSIPFVFYTADVRADILRRWPQVPVLTKLAGKERILEVVASVLR
ncbi:MAG TPA: response regulator [Hyphomicrobiaceae bacterium]|jgi:DNA-binding response OmpR family regulator|nr:response regulator [Hyphomicrobiaceae bacterium]